MKPINSNIDEFLTKVKVGSDYVCTRMLYKHAVMVSKLLKYSKASPELLKQLSEHVC